MIRRKPSISIYYDTRRKKANGKFPVKLRLTASWLRQKDKYIYLNIDLTKEEWQQVEGRGKSKDIIHVREKLERQLADARKIVDGLRHYTHGAFMDRFVTGIAPEKFVYDFFNLKIRTLTKKGKFSTAAGYKGALSALKEFRRNKEIYFQDVTRLFLEKFIQFLKDQGKAPATIERYFVYFRAVYNMAIQEKIISSDDSPFTRNMKPEKGEPKKKALSDSDITQILTYSSTDKRKQLARDVWVFSFCVGGINLTDMARLTSENIDGDGIGYTRGKTHDKKKQDHPVVLFLNVYAKAIIKRYDGGKYLFPILEPGMDKKQEHNRIKWHTKKANKMLKQIADEIGISRFTTSSARDSFATRLARMGVDVDQIGIKLGHAPGSKMTPGYIRHEAVNSMDIMNELINIR